MQKIPTTMEAIQDTISYRDKLLANREEVAKLISVEIARTLLNYLNSTDTVSGYKNGH